MLKSRVMGERLYYTDSYTSEFPARVVETQQTEGAFAVVLDRSYFYPTSGGQPYDTGNIEGIPVIDVQVRKEDGAILHVVESLPQREEVTAAIDWRRRFDHMQQHTGQHILSQAFMQTLAAQTIGFHLSDVTATIDLDVNKIDQGAIEKAEDLANQVVWQNRPVVVRWATRQEAELLPLRKIPENGGEKLRLIDIVDFDLTACGGTHVARTGEVGLIKVIKTETRNKKVRIHFCCGGRALQQYRLANDVVQALSSQLTTGATELSASVNKIQESEKEARRTVKRLQNQLSEIEAQQLLKSGRETGKATVIVHVLEGEADRVRGLASRLVQNDKTIALLASTGERTQIVFGRADDAPGNMKELLQAACEQLGAGSGGGGDKFAQGTAPAADLESVQQALEDVAKQLVEKIDAIG